MRDVDKKYSELKNIEKGPKKYISRHPKKKKTKIKFEMEWDGGDESNKTSTNKYIYTYITQSHIFFCSFCLLLMNNI